MSSLTIWNERLRNSANQITFGRILLTTAILIIYQNYPILVFMCFLCAALSDLIDGIVARKNGVTDFGGLLDRFADKYLFLAMIYVAWNRLQYPVVSEFLIMRPLEFLIGIEISLVALAVIGSCLGLRVQSKWIGKGKFFSECFIIGFIVFFTLTPDLENFLYAWPVLFALQIALLLTVVLAVLSLLSYTWEYAGVGWASLKQLCIRLFYGGAQA